MLDTAVIIPVYGDRVNLLSKTMVHHMRQTLDVEFIIPELRFGGEKHEVLDQYHNIKRIVIEGKDSHKDLCQKEAMINIGASYLHDDIKYVIFLDCDVFSFDTQWFEKIRNKIEGEDSVVQCFSHVIDTEDVYYSFISVANKMVNNIHHLSHNPGIGWGISRHKLSSMGGLNPYFIEYSGDSAFIKELFDIDEFGGYKNLQHLLRDVNVDGNMTYVDVSIVHLHHGYLQDRSYDSRKMIVDLWKRDVHDVIKMSDEGLIEWIDPRCPERATLKQFQWLKDNPHEVKRMFSLVQCPMRDDAPVHEHDEREHKTFARPDDSLLRLREYEYAEGCIQCRTSNIFSEGRGVPAVRSQNDMVCYINSIDNDRSCTLSFPLLPDGRSIYLNGHWHLEFSWETEGRISGQVMLCGDGYTSGVMPIPVNGHSGRINMNLSDLTSKTHRVREIKLLFDIDELLKISDISLRRSSSHVRRDVLVVIYYDSEEQAQSAADRLTAQSRQSVICFIEYSKCLIGRELLDVIESRDVDYVVLLDSSVIIHDHDWLNLMVRMIGDDASIVQGFGEVTDPEDPDFHGISHCAHVSYWWKSDVVEKGLAWAMTKNKLMKLSNYGYSPSRLPDILNCCDNNTKIKCVTSVIQSAGISNVYNT